MATGIATNFASPLDLKRYRRAKARGLSEAQALSVGDNGIGAPSLGAVSTPNSYGIAVPTSYLREHFGKNPADWRSARANLTYGNTTVSVPFVDVGPGRTQQEKGVITDLTYPLSQELGSGDWAKVKVEPSDTRGPDYKKDTIAWTEDQARIADQLKSQKMEPSPTPLAGITTGVGGQDDDELRKAILKAQYATSLSDLPDLSDLNFTS